VIVVTRLNGAAFGLNPDLIQRVECAPDTVVTLVDGTKYVIAQTLDDLVDRITEHKARVLARAQEIVTPEPSHDGGPQLVLHDGGGDEPPPSPPVPLRPRSR
jgi:flagellar protein FlbD